MHVKHVGHAARDYVGQFARHGVFGYRGEFFAHASVHFVNHFLGIGRGQGFKSGSVFEDFVQERSVQAGVGHFVLHAAHGVADDYRGAVAVKLFFVVAGIFQSHTGGFNGQVLHRVHLFGDLRRNAVF